VQKFVIHHPAEPFVGRRGIEVVAIWLYAQTQVVERDAGCAGVSIIIEVLEEDGDRFCRVVVKERTVRAQGIFERTDQVRNDIRVGPVVVDELEIAGPHGEELRPERGCEDEAQDEQPGSPDRHRSVCDMRKTAQGRPL
jgi:hypothetical protein